LKLSSAAAVRPQVAFEDVALIPFPPADVEKLWAWMHEYPKANFDDSAPPSLEVFKLQMLSRASVGQKLIEVQVSGEPVGAIALQKLSPTTAQFRGICFTKSVHGTGVARLAVETVLMALWAEGIEKVSADYMADNRRIRQFLARLGAVDEGYFKGETRRNEKPVDVRRVAIFKPQEV
jgi:RimJ/RimL family protein N-acetyltransferase